MSTTTIPTATQAQQGTGRVYRPRVDILEREHELLVLADMPGTTAGAIDIRYEDGTLSIHGKVPQRPDEERRELLQEYGVGDFQRSFRLGQQIDASSIRAEYVQGVLTVHLPKVEAARPRRIEVRPGN
jgi:HSP20 family protein